MINKNKDYCKSFVVKEIEEFPQGLNDTKPTKFLCFLVIQKKCLNQVPGHREFL